MPRRMARAPWSWRALLCWVLCAGAAQAASPAPASRTLCEPWPAWQRFQRQFVSADGRVIDPHSERAHSTSEGQAYALFFALVANDRVGFARLLRWTENNLADGDLAARLPAWQWGRHDSGRWQVLDANAASDADLWLVYALAEAGRLWGERRYIALASLLAARVLREETAEIPGLGRVLLPGPRGFGPWPQGPGMRARLNPSYLPLPLLRWLVARSDSAAWQQVLASSLRLLTDAAPQGFAPDWVDVEGHGAAPAKWSLGEHDEGRVGAYNAIRVYLWLGLSSPDDPALPALLRHYRPMLARVDSLGHVPTQADAASGATSGQGSPGFTAAMLPFVERQGRADLANALAAALAQTPALADAYYDQSLTLFALGFRERRYRFEADGSLTPGWIACTESSSLSR